MTVFGDERGRRDARARLTALGTAAARVGMRRAAPACMACLLGQSAETASAIKITIHAVLSVPTAIYAPAATTIPGPFVMHLRVHITAEWHRDLTRHTSGQVWLERRGPATCLGEGSLPGRLTGGVISATPSPFKTL